MINEILSAILQVLFFTSIPLLVYFIKNRSTAGFLNYIGLKRSAKRANFLAVLVCLLVALPIIALIYLRPDFWEIMTNPASVTGKIRQMGLSTEAVIIVIVIAGFKTSLSEEILFRGFIAKRLISITNFQTGNILQAILFGIIHTALFMTISSNIFFLIMIFLLPATVAYLIVYLNEKMAGGSIIPGWIAHGLGNIISYSTIGFLI